MKINVKHVLFLYFKYFVFILVFVNYDVEICFIFNAYICVCMRCVENLTLEGKRIFCIQKIIYTLTEKI